MTIDTRPLFFKEVTDKLRELSKEYPDTKLYLIKNDDYSVAPERVSSAHSERMYYNRVALSDRDWGKDAMTISELSKFFTALSKKKKFLHKDGGEYSPYANDEVYYGDGIEPGTMMVHNIEVKNKFVAYIYAYDIQHENK